MREPAFWWRAPGGAAALLAPLAALYGAVAARRLAQAGHDPGVPVICVGNPTVGGAGKTPAAIAIARILAETGEKPALLSRGYGGSLAGPVRVDGARHAAAEVGDEPLLLARAAPTIVARDRVAGAACAVAAGASAIVMDDGFQNPSLAKTVALLVVDARRGVGNGRVIPAGPLRAPLDAQLARADALVLVGPTSAAVETLEAKVRTRKLPIMRSRIVADAGALAQLRDRPVLAFAGIGAPDKLFATLAAAGIAVRAARRFADHHRYTAAEAQALLAEAERERLTLVTTEKDLARMRGDESVLELATCAVALPVELAFDDPPALLHLLRDRMGRRQRGAKP